MTSEEGGGAGDVDAPTPPPPPPSSEVVEELPSTTTTTPMETSATKPPATGTGTGTDTNTNTNDEAAVTPSVIEEPSEDDKSSGVVEQPPSSDSQLPPSADTEKPTVASADDGADAGDEQNDTTATATTTDPATNATSEENQTGKVEETNQPSEVVEPVLEKDAKDETEEVKKEEGEYLATDAAAAAPVNVEQNSKNTGEDNKEAVEETPSLAIPETETASDGPKESHDTTAPTGESKETPAVAADAAAMTTDSAETSSTAGSSTTTPISQTKGAQILMSRFSSWKTTANERASTLLKTQAPVLLEENAKQAQEYLTKFSTRFPVVSSMGRSSTNVSDSGEGEGKQEGSNSNEITAATLSPVQKQEDDNNETQNANGVPNTAGEGTTASLIDETEDEESGGSGGDNRCDGSDDSDYDSEDDETTTVSGVETASGAGTDYTLSSAAFGDSTLYSRERMRAVLSRASVAGSAVAETMSTGFRGRYTGDVLATPTKGGDQSTREPSPESQIQLIMKSRAAEHMQDILSRLEDYEYAMLLGRGMLGVNLKQCFLKNHGIYVDYLVEGGQAQLSGLIRSGDLVVRLGESDFKKGTIKDVPLEIAQAKRPSVLVMATGTKVPVERINYVDIAVAMMHRARKKHGKRLSDNKEGGNDSNLKGEMSSDDQLSKGSMSLTEKEEKTDDLVSASAPDSVCSMDIPFHDTIDSYRSPPGPSLDLQKEFVEESPSRCLDKFNLEELRDIVDLDKNFRASLRNAFLLCALDGRRLPFLSKHFSNDVQLSEDAGGASSELTDVMSEDISNTMTPSAQMMLFLELSSFLDLYDVTPSDQLRESAKRIAYKFFLPTKIGTGLQPPLFDFHHIVADSSLRHLEAVLSGKSKTIPRDLFLDFQRSIVDTLSASPFLSFLGSTECSRMRGYLRDTAPYVNLPLKTIVDTISDSTASISDENISSAVGAKNCFAYTLLYLVCKMEKDAMGEYDFGLEKEANRRLLGAPNDLCCVIFVQRTLLPLLEGMKKQVEGLKPGESIPKNDCRKLMHALEQLWDLWVADTIDLSSRPTSSSVLFEKVRNTLSTISAENDARDYCSQKCLETVLKSTLTEDVTKLVDELLLEHASTVHTKFRDHKFHEWMCSELNKVSLSSSHQWSTSKASIPILPQGCIQRLLRKAELPESVSVHKPYKASSSHSDIESNQQYHNADWAVVFGSSVGPDLASQMAVPGLEALDVRRYTCLPVDPDSDIDYDEFRPETVLPATFEGYAVVPPCQPKPFAQIVDDGRVSIDGWHVSLVTFTIPNAGSSTSGDDSESSLFGVSLCLNRVASDPSCDVESGEVSLELVEQGQIASAGGNWKSPIRFEESEKTGGSKSVRKVSVSSDVPVFSSRLQQQSWEERIRDDQYRDQSSPPVVGIALVSRRNVVLAMRDTLSRLLFDYSRGPNQSLEEAQGAFSCNALVTLLGAFSHQDHEGSALKVILEPYIRSGCSPWVDRPLLDQSQAFELFALKQLTDSLPPTPLGLIFVTALLEQKIIISSSRRSVLRAACTALVNLLRPLKWSHLLVPLVPGALAADLIQYPAPFLLGVPSEDADNMNLLGSLPRDVTLVDLDVGRVILAPSFGQDNEMVRKATDADATARALRSQVLYLAQGLGTVFGNSLRSRSWQCDNPTLTSDRDTLVDSENSGLERLRNTSSSFIMELLEGTTSCCYWIEEAAQGYGTSTEPSVLFDEDKFFERKNHRSTKAWKPLFLNENHKANTGSLALSLTDFDLIMESLLRTQSFSLHVSSSSKTEMLYY